MSALVQKTLTEVAVGALAAAALVAVGRALGTERQVRLYAVGLVVVALIYVGFAATAGLAGWIAVDLAGAAVFATLAWLGVRRSIRFTAFGWLLHVGWDAGLHGWGASGHVPSWYPGVCVGFDLVVAAYVAVGLRRRPASG